MRRLVMLLVCAGGSLSAQTVAGSDNLAMSTIRENWRNGHNYILRSAEQLPESLYKFKPVPTVRSFGELIGHVAGADAMFCAAALGEPPRQEDAVEKAATTKAALIQALKDAGVYCERAYAMTDAAARGMTKFFGSDRTKFHVLTLNAIHDWEHYGNIVTYLRINGFTPPSSQPAPR